MPASRKRPRKRVIRFRAKMMHILIVETKRPKKEIFGAARPYREPPYVLSPYVWHRLCAQPPMYRPAYVLSRLCTDPLMCSAAYVRSRLCKEPLIYGGAYVLGRYIASRLVRPLYSAAC